MKTALLVSWLIIAFLLGCVSSNAIVPAVRAGADASTRWEYFVVSGTWVVPGVDELNEAGERGWELVHVDKNGSGYFKRRVP